MVDSYITFIIVRIEEYVSYYFMHPPLLPKYQRLFGGGVGIINKKK